MSVRVGNVPVGHLACELEGFGQYKCQVGIGL